MKFLSKKYTVPQKIATPTFSSMHHLSLLSPYTNLLATKTNFKGLQFVQLAFPETCWLNSMSNTSTQVDKCLWSEPHNQDYSFSFKTSINRFQMDIYRYHQSYYTFQVNSVFFSLLCLFHIFSLLLCIAFRL